MSPTARGLRQQNALRVCVVAGLALWLLMGSGALRAAGTATGPAAADETFESYTRTATTLQPLAQIEAWIGYLRLHPDSPHRANVRMRLQLLAVSLTEDEEAALLDFLAFQQLPRELNALEPAARAAAASTFINRHPRFFGPGAHDEAFVALVTRAGVPDARALLARAPGRSSSGVAGTGGNIFAPTPAGSTAQGGAGQASVARDSSAQGSVAREGGGPANTARDGAAQANAAREGGGQANAARDSAGQVRATGVSVAGAGNGASGATGAASTSTGPSTSSSVASASGVAGGGMSSSATPDAGSSTSSSSAAPGDTSAKAGEQASTASSTPQIAMLPPSAGGQPEPEERRLRRWIDATAEMSPESQQQLWAMYLLLYPESPYAGQARDHLETATAAVKRKTGTAAVSEAEHARIETENRELKQLLEESEAGRRRARGVIIGGVSVLLLILLLIGIS